MTKLQSKYIEDLAIKNNHLDATAKQSVLESKLTALRTAVLNFAATSGSSSATVTTEVEAAATTDVAVTDLATKGIYTGAVSGATSPNKVLVRVAGTDNGLYDANYDDVYATLTEAEDVYTLNFFNSDGTVYTFSENTNIDFYFVEIFDEYSKPADAHLRNSVGGVVDATTASSVNNHKNATTDAHEGTAISYNRLDAEKSNILAASDDVESALNDLDDILGDLSSVASPSTYTPSENTVTAHLAAIDTAISNGGGAKQAVDAATTSALPAATYSNGTAGVGATLTASANGALPSIDGVILSASDRILVKNQTTASENGVYVVTQLGDAGTPFILTRATDCDESAELVEGKFIVLAKAGNVNLNAAFYLNASVTTVGTDSQTFVRFNDTVFTDAALQILNASDNTKVGDFDLSNITSGQSRTIIYADRDVNLDNITVAARESFTLTATDITNKYVVLTNAPKVAAATQMSPAGAPLQVYGTDFEVTADDGGKRLSWSVLGLDGILEAGEVIQVWYNYNG